MKKMKTRITISIIISSILICILFMIGTNIAASLYINMEAKKAIEKSNINSEFFNNIEVISEGALYVNEDLNMTILQNSATKSEGVQIVDSGFNIGNTLVEENSLFDVRFFYYTDTNESQFSFEYINGDDQNIAELIKENKITVDEIQYHEINNKSYYLKMIEIKEKSSDQAKKYVTIYVSITNIKNIVDRVNIIFVLLTLISILVFGFGGLKAGEYIENSQKKMKHFFENASHELKTPLMSIQGYAEGVKTGVIGKDEGIDTIIRQSDNMQLLIEEILNLSKIDSGQLIITKNEVNLYYLIEDLIRDLGDLITVDIFVSNNLKKDMPTIIGDELQLAKAFKTVIFNGIKFAKTKVSISYRVDSSFVYIYIEDDGSGISKDDLSHIFDRFYSKNNVSNGIGLAMAKEIFLLCGGDIEAICGKVGLFQIKLPINK